MVQLTKFFQKQGVAETLKASTKETDNFMKTASIVKADKAKRATVDSEWETRIKAHLAMIKEEQKKQLKFPKAQLFQFIGIYPSSGHRMHWQVRYSDKRNLLIKWTQFVNIHANQARTHGYYKKLQRIEFSMFGEDDLIIRTAKTADDPSVHIALGFLVRANRMQIKQPQGMMIVIPTPNGIKGTPCKWNECVKMYREDRWFPATIIHNGRVKWYKSIMNPPGYREIRTRDYYGERVLGEYMQQELHPVYFQGGDNLDLLYAVGKKSKKKALAKAKAGKK